MSRFGSSSDTATHESIRRKRGNHGCCCSKILYGPGILRVPASTAKQVTRPRCPKSTSDAHKTFFTGPMQRNFRPPHHFNVVVHLYQHTKDVSFRGTNSITSRETIWNHPRIFQIHEAKTLKQNGFTDASEKGNLFSLFCMPRISIYWEIQCRQEPPLR